VVRLPVQPHVFVKVCWKDLASGRGAAVSLFVHGDEVVGFDCFGEDEDPRAQRPPPRQAAQRRCLPERSVEEQIERSIFELTSHLDHHLQRSPRRRIRRARVDRAALEQACAEARERMRSHLEAARAPRQARSVAGGPGGGDSVPIWERVRTAPEHSGGEFASHLEGTAALLRDWGCRPALQRAGRYHAVYGNPKGRRAIVSPETGELAAEIGEEAETLVRLWSIVDRGGIAAAARERSRWGARDGESVALPLVGGGAIGVSRSVHRDLAHLYAANLLEQAPRTGRDGRRLGALRPLLCPAALAALGLGRRPPGVAAWCRRLAGGAAGRQRRAKATMASPTGRGPRP
jgi:hypothetical protein